MISGPQDFWLTGSRFYFRRRTSGDVSYPLVDLGVIQPVNPAIELSRVELLDSDGGVLKKVAEQVVRIDETYEITCSNMNAHNRSMLFMGGLPEEFTQTAVQIPAVPHLGAVVGSLVKLENLTGVPAFGVGSVDAVGVGNRYTISAVTDGSAGSASITVAGEDAADDLEIGDEIVLMGNDAEGIFTITALTADSGTTEIEVAEAIADSTNAGYVALAAVEGKDYEVVSLDRGIIRLLAGGSLELASGAVTDLAISFTPTAITGKRLIRPQTIHTIEGRGYIFYSRDSHTRQSVRYAEVSLSPQNAAMQVDNYSTFGLRVAVLSDPIEITEPAGRLLDFKGELEATS
jgi:hypothetical protein